jgi:MtrB/PioB family decaheme-associated outer membrane protein
MRTSASNAFPLAAITAATLAAFGSAWAADDDAAAGLAPGSSISIGAGLSTNEAPRFGQYTGINEDKVYGLLDLDLVKRDDATGTWLKFTGRSLGLDSRELRFEHNRQGNWGYFVEFSQIPRFDPYTVNTRLSGIGESTQTVNGLAAAQPFKLELNRDRTTVGFDKNLARGFDVQVRFRNEEKEGSRLFGQGTFGTWNFLTDPINYTTRQLEATASYTMERLQLSGGYYGTDFTNKNPALNVVGGIAGFSPIALPPGNQSHKLFLDGGYSFTPTTRGTFKVAYTNQTQTEAFVAPSIVGRTDLGGEVNTTLLQMAVTSRPMPKLSLLASLRYEDRDDKTPVLPYLTTGVSGSSTLDGSNEPRSIEATTGKAEASYSLPMGFRVTGGLDYDLRKRNTYRVRAVSHRDETEEVSYRAELRRSMSETVTGALSYIYSDRGGSDFLTTVANNNTLGSNLVHPLHLADRERNRVRLMVNWQAAEPLSIQFFTDYAEDKYSGRALGPRKGEAQTYSVDASYVFSDKWQASAWVSRNDTKADQSTCVSAGATGVCPGTAGNPLWDASLHNLGEAIGAGLRGKPYAWLEAGADVTYSRDKSEYRLSAVTPGASVASPPDAHFDLTRINLFVKYAIQKNSGVRVNYIFDRWSTDDWTWRNWTYSDGTRVLEDPTQKVHFVGVSYYYRWQ